MHKVKVILYSGFPEILSNATGNIKLEFSETNGKEYTFLNCEKCIELSVGDYVICNVKSTMCIGQVIDINTEEVEKYEYVRKLAFAVENNRQPLKLIIAKIDLSHVEQQLQYMARHRRAFNAVKELEAKKSRIPVNEKAFDLSTRDIL